MTRLIETKSKSLRCSSCQRPLDLTGVFEGHLAFACHHTADEHPEVNSIHTVVWVDAKKFDMDDLQRREDVLPF